MLLTFYCDHTCLSCVDELKLIKDCASFFFVHNKNISWRCIFNVVQYTHIHREPYIFIPITLTCGYFKLKNVSKLPNKCGSTPRSGLIIETPGNSSGTNIGVCR